MSQYDILFCSEILDSDMRRVSELLVPGFGHPVLCRGKMPRACGVVAYVRDGYGAFCQPKFECDCEMLVLRVYGVRQNLCVYSLYCNPDIDDWIFYCVPAEMALLCRLRLSVPLSCLWVILMAIIRSGWVLRPRTVMVCGCRTIMVQHFATVSSCDQLVVGPTHARGGTVDLPMTDVPDLVQVAVVAPIDNPDHSSLLPVILMAQAVPNLFVSRKVFLKHKVNFNTVCCAIRELPWHNIWLSDNPVEVLNEHLCLLVGCCVPTKVIHVHNNNKPWFDDQCRHAFGLKQEAHLQWTKDVQRVCPLSSES